MDNQYSTLFEVPEVEVMFNVGKVFSHVFCNCRVAVGNEGVKDNPRQ